MKIIAFKRAGQNTALHPEFITEWVDASLIANTEGYETMIEEHFELELSKNEERHKQHLQYLKEQELARLQAERDKLSVQMAEEKELEREFNRFKAWQRHQGKK